MIGLKKSQKHSHNQYLYINNKIILLHKIDVFHLINFSKEEAKHSLLKKCMQNKIFGVGINL